MGSHEGGRWDVSVKDGAVYVERISDDDEQLFDDSLDVEEARKLAGLLTKFADKLDELAESGKTEDSDDSDKSDESEDSDKEGSQEADKSSD